MFLYLGSMVISRKLKGLTKFIPLMTVMALAGCNTASVAPLAIATAGAAGGYLAGGAIDDSDGAKIGGMAVGLIAASQAYEYMETGNEQKIVEAYEQGKREARIEVSNSYWRAVTSADGTEYHTAQEGEKKLRLIDRDPHVTEGIIYGARFIDKNTMQTRGE